MSNTRNRMARDTALCAVQNLETASTPLVKFASRGRVVLISGEATLGSAALLAEENLQVQVVQTNGVQEPGYPTVYLGDRPIKLNGWLGAFVLELGVAGEADYERIDVDLVLELSPQSSFAMPITPLGYAHAYPEEAVQIAAAVEQLAQLRGTFAKPKFFAYDESICTHKRSGVEACRNCLDTCPTDAIISLAEKIEVNPNLCQGGGVCATVCPSGAIRYRYPSAEDTLHQVFTLLDSYRLEGGLKPVLAFVADANSGVRDNMPDNVLCVVVEELGSVGIELWLQALTAGAVQVLLLDGGEIPDRVRSALDQQLLVCGSILQGMGYSERSVRVLPLDEIAAGVECAMPPLRPIPHAQIDRKRQELYFAIDSLFQQAPVTAETVELPAGAPFGRIQVDRDSCTLCMSCTSICPLKALQSGVQTPRLIFNEENCVQCGLCANACPEQAITLRPLLTLDPERRRQSVVLCEDEPFCCVECGKAFATNRIIGSMLGKLSGHYMFQSERATRRLKMCEDCRVIDVVQDEDMMGTSGLH